MPVSVIIPTLNAGDRLEELLSSLLFQETKPLEIIIIDSSSEDNTLEIAERLGAKVIVIPRESFNHGKTRNMAAGEACGDILAFMTQDALPYDSTMLGNLVAPLCSPGIAASYGRQVPRADASPLEVFARRFNYPDTPFTKGKEDIPTLGIKTFFFSNVCSAVRKDFFLAAGMFPEGVRSNEDMLLAARFILSGFKISYLPGAKVIHSHNYSILRQFRRYYNTASAFRKNAWILNYGRPDGEGKRFVREQMRFLLEEHRYALLPYVFLESLAKYAGYRIGLLAG
ncbi:MAG TPA: glycosyltransferase family 2 protein [Thermodesulfovibrionales bacterium]|nr:glycosyltransferase family 2 protein [Thermodesulfovibrionales bacterium]